jgi:hypothetical protein
MLSEPIGLGDGRFQFTLIAEAGHNYDIQATTNLVDWVTISTVPNPTGTITVTDNNAPLYRYRFYRAVSSGVALPSVSLANPVRTPGQFTFTLIGGTGQVVRIDAGTNLVNWSPLTTVTNSTGVMQVTDPAANVPLRVYRAVIP